MNSTTGPNWWKTLLGVTGVIILLWIPLMLIIKGTTESTLAACAVSVFLTLPWTLSVLFQPCSLEMDQREGLITYRNLLGLVRQVRLDEVTGFSSADMSRSTSKIRILYLMDGRHLEFSTRNLRTIDDLEAFLQRNGIKYLGHEWSAFPFKKFRYRFHPK
jgi:hypothetical protein